MVRNQEVFISVSLGTEKPSGRNWCHAQMTPAQSPGGNPKLILTPQSPPRWVKSRLVMFWKWSGPFKKALIVSWTTETQTLVHGRERGCSCTASGGIGLHFSLPALRSWVRVNLFQYFFSCTLQYIMSLCWVFSLPSDPSVENTDNTQITRNPVKWNEINAMAFFERLYRSRGSCGDEYDFSVIGVYVRTFRRLI